jgi:hypothetical protein
VRVEEYERLKAEAYVRHNGEKGVLEFTERFPPEKLGVEFPLVEILSIEKISRAGGGFGTQVSALDSEGKAHVFRTVRVEDRKYAWIDYKTLFEVSNYRAAEIAILYKEYRDAEMEKENPH